LVDASSPLCWTAGPAVDRPVAGQVEDPHPG
jgi:hypothetical protein